MKEHRYSRTMRNKEADNESERDRQRAREREIPI
jgi:hypothetical protein